jgi:signal transduction histidine kinase/integral membrane sensor domain MASE1
MTTRTTLPLRWALGFALSYAVLAVGARLTVVDGRTVSLVWPGAGIAVLWLLAESPHRQGRVLAPLLAIHLTVAWFTGAPSEVVVLGALSLTCQTWLTVLLLRRWCPTLLGAGGTESFRSPRTLAYTCGAGALGSLLGAGIGTLGVWLSDAPLGMWEPQAWFGRHFTGILVVGCIGHLAWEWHTQHVSPRARGGSRLELVALWVFSVFAVAVIFLQPLPIVFLVVPLCVWSAARFPTFLAALHALALGVAGLVLTLAGVGPSTSLNDPVREVLVGQIFLVAVLLTSLAVGTLSDRIDELVLRMGRARATAAEQAELLAEMTESMDEGLIVLDRAGRIERSNGASRRLAHRVHPGAPDDVALADLVETVLNPAAVNTSASRAELGVGDVHVPLPSGDDMVLAVSQAVLASQRGDDSRSGLLLVLSEVTEHRRGMRPLVGFASTAAHDLRGPLTAICSWLDLAAQDLDPDSDTLASLERAQRSARQMADLIDDLLAHAVAEAGDLAARDIPLSGRGGVWSGAVAMLGPDDVLEVRDGLPRVHADEVAVGQLFANLVGNAVKYARPGVPARIDVRAQRQGSRVVVDVEDNGVGVAEHERTLIFQRFHRSDTVRAGFRGTGMGLSICQTIVSRHGGSIECLPAEPGPGSVFRFDLPAATSGVGPGTATDTRLDELLRRAPA